ncbi:MAG TPA: phosphatidate cytidylyltransferase [Kineosporiaceae bacterium]|nr:phosphatidate cytidylyltransferase [Kineosporiaceae bacterium]
MTDASTAAPEPPRRRRRRGHAAGGPGEDDAWAHPAGRERSWVPDAGSTPAASSTVDAQGRFRPDTPFREASSAALPSRRAARRVEARAGDADDSQVGAGTVAGPPGPGGAAGLTSGDWPAGSSGLPLRPWWAAAVAEAAGTPSGGVPAAFMRAESAARALDRTVQDQVPAEVPQVNPWPGHVRPAVPTVIPGTGSRHALPQRTSDVAPARMREDPSNGASPDHGPAGWPQRTAEVVLPAVPAEVVLTDAAPAEISRSEGPAGPRAGELGLPRGQGNAFGVGPVLPPPEPPGPVLPGVDGLARPAEEPTSAPVSRRRRAARPATGPVQTPDAASAGIPSRRRLSTAPVRFPAFDPTGEPVETGGADRVSLRAVPAATAAPAAAGRAPSTSEPGSTATTALLGRAGRRPASQVPASGAGIPLPSISGPASAPPGARGISLPGVGTPGSLAGVARDLGAEGSLTAGSLAAGQAAVPAGMGADLSGGLASGGLDVVAGLGPRTGRVRARMNDLPPAQGRDRSPGRTPLRAVSSDPDDDGELTRMIGRVRATSAAGPRDDAAPEGPVGSDGPVAPEGVAGSESSIGSGGVLSPEGAVGSSETPAPRAMRRSRRGGIEPASAPTSAGRGRRRSAVRLGREGRADEQSAAVLTPGPAGPTSRAGRNLPAAIGVGVLLGALVLASLLLRKEAFVVLVAAAILTALWELSGVLRVKRLTVARIPLSVGAVGMLVSAFVAGEDGLVVSFALTAFGVLLWRIIDGCQAAARDVAASVFVAAYVPFLAGFAMLMLAMPDGAYRVLAFMSVTVANDIGGYATGVLFGRHPMAPTISPKKSWEGLAGSVALCMIVGAGTVHYLLHGSLLAGLALGAVAAATATIGDLSESLIKRDLGIKDMGNLLPGHGGIMDRLDSLLPTAPAAYLVLLLLVPVAAR